MAKLNGILNSIGRTISGIPNSISKFFTPKVTAPEPVPVQKPINSYLLKDRGVAVTDEDFEALKPVIYGEISNRGIDKKKLEANVMINTIINRAKQYSEHGTPKKLSEIVAMPNQYQAYGGSQYNQYSNPTLPLDIAKKQEVDMILNEIYDQIKAGTYKDTTGGAAFYIHKPNGQIQYNQKSLFAK